MTPLSDDPAQDPTPAPKQRPAPSGPQILPDWGGLGSRTFARSSPEYFDAEGKPQVASAREIAPDEDNPLWPWQRLGLAIFWRSARLERVLPRNVRNNALLFYFTGRLRGRWWEDLMAFVPWLPLIALDVLLGVMAVRTLLDPLLMNSYSWLFFSIIFVEVIFLLPVVGVVGLLTVLYHLGHIQERVPFDELAISRLTNEEVLYGLMARPVGNLHFANFAMLVISGLGVLVVGVISGIMASSLTVEPWLTLLLVPLLFIALLFRWLLFAVSIDIGGTTALRAFLFIRGHGPRVRRAAWDWLRVGGGFPVLSPVAAMFLMTAFVVTAPYGCFVSCLMLVVIGMVAMMWLRYVREIPIYASNILIQTATHAGSWWVRTGESTPADHVVFRD
jgi:hypothetical protein